MMLLRILRFGALYTCHKDIVHNCKMVIDQANYSIGHGDYLMAHKRVPQFLALAMLILPCAAFSQTENDHTAVLKTFESWNAGWSKGDAELAVQDYAEDADWTNAFGDRFQGRDELEKGLEYIFSLGFVMSGETGGNEYSDIRFLSPTIAVVRSKLVRKDQRTSTGELMPDRHINHLRVLERRNGTWQIVSHLISQAKEKM